MLSDENLTSSPSFRARVPRGLEGYAPFTGATRLWSTMKERGFLIIEIVMPVAFFKIFNAPFKSE